MADSAQSVMTRFVRAASTPQTFAEAAETPDPSDARRFLEISDRLNAYLRGFRAVGIRSDREVARYLCVDGAELSRFRNARVGAVNLYRGYDMLRKCEELARRLSEQNVTLKGRLALADDPPSHTLPCVDQREWQHVQAVQEKSVRILLTIGASAQRGGLDELIGAVARSVVHPRRNPYGPMNILYVLRCVESAPAATTAQLAAALRIAQVGRRACEPDRFNPELNEQTRTRTLGAILGAAGGVALRLSTERPTDRDRMSKLARFLYERSLEMTATPPIIAGAITCARATSDTVWLMTLETLPAGRES
jgi:hypothetical protein